MRRWAVTGPAGGGKSAFCGFLAECGAAIISGDSLGHEILANPDIVLAIGRRFGREFVGAGEVDRAALGKLVFADPHRLEQLNWITHGPLAALAGRRLEELESEGRHRLAVLEAAVYFALPPVPGIELVITVTASETTRLARLTGPGGLTPGNARRRIRAQQSLQEGWASADVVLNNEGTLADLQAAAEKLWSRLED
jgi:dephospho-CoA kinase